MVWSSNTCNIGKKTDQCWDNLPGKKARLLFLEVGPEKPGYLWQKFITVGLNVKYY